MISVVWSQGEKSEMTLDGWGFDQSTKGVTDVSLLSSVCFDGPTPESFHGYVSMLALEGGEAAWLCGDRELLACSV